MEKTRSEVYRENRPEISEEDVAAAAQAERIVTSFNARPVFIEGGKIVAIAIKWKLGNGMTETILIDRHPATILQVVFDRLKENDWSGTVLIPDDATLQ